MGIIDITPYIGMGEVYPKQKTINNLKGEGIVPLMIKDEVPFV